MADAPEKDNKEKGKRLPFSRRAILSTIVIVVIGALSFGLIFITLNTEPKAQRETETRETAMLVTVEEVTYGDHRPLLRALGRVEAERDIVLSPEVEGRIASISEKFTIGGYFERGEEIISIEPADYEAVAQQRRSDLLLALSDLKLEAGQQEVARQDLELLGDSLSQGANRDLVLRIPQLNSAIARVQSAMAALRLAELNVERTTLRAPFNGQLLEKYTDVGSRISPGDNLGRLVGTEVYQVIATIPAASLSFVIAEGATWNNLQIAADTPVKLYNRTAWPADTFREGRLTRLVGVVDEETRLARLVILVEDPLGQKLGNPAEQLEDEMIRKPPLILGFLLEAEIPGRTIKDSIRLRRELVRDNDTVWVKDGEELRVKKVDIIFEDASHAYITGGLDNHALVVTTNLSTVTDGARLRTENEEKTSQQKES